MRLHSRLIRTAVHFALPATFWAAVNPLELTLAEEVKQGQSSKATSNQATAPKSISGWYLTGAAGYLWESPINESRTSTTYSARLGREIDQDRDGVLNLGSGVAAEAGFGYDFGNKLRAEITYLFDTTPTGSLDYDGTITYSGGGSPRTNDTFSGAANLSGRVYRNSALASLYYDFPTKSRWVPYVGGGIGWTSVSTTDIVYSYNVALGSGGRSVGNLTVPGGSGSAFGYQAKIGISYITSKTSDVFVEGNYLGNTSVYLGSGLTFGSFNSYGVKAGFRYRFGK